MHSFKQLSSIQAHSRVQLFTTPWTAAHQASLSITNSRSSLRLTSIESVMPSSHLILCYPLLLLPPIPPSISLFQWVNTSHEVAKVLEFQPQHHSFQRTPRTDLRWRNSSSICFPLGYEKKWEGTSGCNLVTLNLQKGKRIIHLYSVGVFKIYIYI